MKVTFRILKTAVKGLLNAGAISLCVVSLGFMPVMIVGGLAFSLATNQA